MREAIFSSKASRMESDVFIPLGETLSPQDRRDRAEQKFGTDVIRAGYQVVPDVLVRYQGRLGLSPTDVCVLLNLGAHWWYPESQPSPRSQTIAHRMNVHVRMVQRSLSSLKAAGFIDLHKEGGRRHYDLKPLVKRLEALAERDLWSREK